MNARAYLRVSTQAQEVYGVSLETQRDTIERYAREQGLTIVAWYTDVMSGRRDDRPEYTRMLAELEPGETVLLYRLDRVGRKKSELFRFFEWAKQQRIAIIPVTQPEMANELARDIMSVLAAWESQQIAERVGPALMMRVEEGRWVTTIPKWYEMGADGHLTPAPEAHHAQECWEMYLRTGNKNMTADVFNLGRRQFWWMLRSPVYVGAIPWKGTVREGAHEAIVDRATWEAARALTESRRHGMRRERNHPALLVGFLYVADTDVRLSHKPMRSKNFAFRYYTNDADRYYRETRYVVRAEYAEEETINALRSLSLSPADRKTVERELRDRAKRDPDKRDRQEITRRITALESEQVQTARMAARGEIAGPIWEQMRRQQAQEMTALMARRTGLPPLPDTTEIAPALDLRVNLAQRIDADYAAGNIAALRILMEAFVRRVEVWGAESPGLRGGAARNWYRDHPPEIRVQWTNLIGS
jgi:DNA invertase Pin-like site-specific DNA recombinase